jgi:hypothetical protein
MRSGRVRVKDLPPKKSKFFDIDEDAVAVSAGLARHVSLRATG